MFVAKFSISTGTGILKDISFFVLGHKKDKNLAWRACLENDLTILINSVDESLPIILPGLYLLSPIVPHLAQECLSELDVENKITWPEADKKYLQEDKVEIVIQINGKKRFTIKSYTDSNEKEIYDKVIKEEYFIKNYGAMNITKSVFVKNRLMNLIIL